MITRALPWSYWPLPCLASSVLPGSAQKSPVGTSRNERCKARQTLLLRVQPLNWQLAPLWDRLQRALSSAIQVTPSRLRLSLSMERATRESWSTTHLTLTTRKRTTACRPARRPLLRARTIATSRSGLTSSSRCSCHHCSCRVDPRSRPAQWRAPTQRLAIQGAYWR